MLKKIFSGLYLLLCTLYISTSPVAAIGPAGFGQEFVSLYATADTYVGSDYPDTPRGSSYYLNVSSGPLGPYHRILIRFDLTPIPQDAEITLAYLKLYEAPGVAGGTLPIEVHRLAIPWMENTVTWNSVPGVLGGSYATTTASAPDYGGYQTWTLTGLVQDWINGSPNYGMTLGAGIASPPSYEYSSITFHSRDATIPTNPDVATFGRGYRPALEVWYRRRLWFSSALLQFLASIFTQPTPTPAVYSILPPPSGVLPTSTDQLQTKTESTSLTPTSTLPWYKQQISPSPTPTATPLIQKFVPYIIDPTTTPTPPPVFIKPTNTPIKVFIKPSVTPTPKLATKPSPTPAKNIKGVATDANRLLSLTYFIKGLWTSIRTIFGMY